jgi:6,7-dimethyl-8-ribityllumazine synthase
MAGKIEHYALPRASFNKEPKVLIVVAPYYKSIAENLLEGAKTEILASNGAFDIAEVPGALEIATAIGIAERLENFDAYVALGCVIRGETTHYHTVCNDSSRGLTLLGLQGLCIGNGILTVENFEQAEERADQEKQNKGGGAAAAALHLLSLSHKWADNKKGIGFKAD